jgi:Tol biopolymer transport system component
VIASLVGLLGLFLSDGLDRGGCKGWFSAFCLPPSAAQAEPVERHLANIRQLTFGNKNAEAYFSFSGNKLVFQSTNDWREQAQATSKTDGGKGLGCYQMYVMDLESEAIKLVSTGVGATTCGYFFPGDRRVLYSSTHLVGPNCPPKPKMEGKYRWALDDYDIFSVRLDGQQIQRLTVTSGYDAEATVSPDGKLIVFTSIRDGDLDLYVMNLDGTHTRRLTDDVGYDGGAFFSPDSRRIVYRASHPREPAAVEEYKTLLAKKLVEPSHLELFVMQADGTGKRQVTANGASNFAPFFHPDGRRIIFSSNLPHPSLPLQGGGEGGGHGPPTFHLYLIGDDGAGLERVTFEGGFNSFPMFSPDGTKLVWISDRHATSRGEFNIFIADWVP